MFPTIINLPCGIDLVEFDKTNKYSHTEHSVIFELEFFKDSGTLNVTRYFKIKGYDMPTVEMTEKYLRNFFTVYMELVEYIRILKYDQDIVVNSEKYFPTLIKHN